MIKINIIGGGIGGLTAANALLQAGFYFALYEQAPQLSEYSSQKICFDLIFLR